MGSFCSTCRTSVCLSNLAAGHSLDRSLSSVGSGRLCVCPASTKRRKRRSIFIQVIFSSLKFINWPNNAYSKTFDKTSVRLSIREELFCWFVFKETVSKWSSTRADPVQPFSPSFSLSLFIVRIVISWTQFFFPVLGPLTVARKKAHILRWNSFSTSHWSCFTSFFYPLGRMSINRLSVWINWSTRQSSHLHTQSSTWPDWL